ncbi:hypothetical protein [Bradyrhizobium yuanmingense]|uniref:hypothetical protein n=1 Tax=Bradyrhizobium yuanmingense TaxID=108015 RepID=UPI003511859B
MLFALDFFIRRIAQGLVLVVLVAMLIFTLLRVVPGDPVRMMLGPMVSASVAEQTAKEMGLRDPIPVQFGRYVSQILTGDFGGVPSSEAHKAAALAAREAARLSMPPTAHRFWASSQPVCPTACSLLALHSSLPWESRSRSA